MEETENADNVVIIDHGKIVASGNPEKLKTQYAKTIFKLKVPQTKKLDNLLKKEGFMFSYHNGYIINMQDGNVAKDFVIKHSDIIKDWEFVAGNMDTVFLNITGRSLKGE